MSELPATKKHKTVKLIGTHNGTFHCDEALAVYLLRQTDDYRDADLIRTRDTTLLETCDIVVDVGAVYDASKLRFDHHQRGFNTTFGNGFQTKLSSAGLVYKHFGKEVLANHAQIPVDDPHIEPLWLKLYEDFIEAIDGIDNGISQYPAEIKPQYRSRTDLSSRVGALNPAWNQLFDAKAVDERFSKASSMAGREFLDRLDALVNVWLPAREFLKAAIESSKVVEPTGKIIVLDQYLPFKDHLYAIEVDLTVSEIDKAIYVVYPDETGGNWRVQAIAVSSDSFESRKALPEPWRGLRDEALSEVTQIPGGIFVHASGFIGGNKTKEGALELARCALAW